jgi:SCY1-like protein 2
MHVQPFNIPNLRIEQRKTSSAEDMARKNSTGMYFVIMAVAVAVARIALVTSSSRIVEA